MSEECGHDRIPSIRAGLTSFRSRSGSPSCLRLPSPTSPAAVLRTAPDLAAQPVALLDGARQRAQVVAANAAARAAGSRRPDGAAGGSRCARRAAAGPARRRGRGAGALLARRSPRTDGRGHRARRRHDRLLPAGQRRARTGAAHCGAELAGLACRTGGSPARPCWRSTLRAGDGRVRVDDDAAFSRRCRSPPAEPTPELAEILADWGVHTLGQLPRCRRPRSAAASAPRRDASGNCAAGQTGALLQPVARRAAFTPRWSSRNRSRRWSRCCSCCGAS